MDRSDPDYAQRWRDRYERSCRDFQAGGSIAVLRASLFGLGYIGARLDDEVRYQDSLRVVHTEIAAPSGRGGFTSGLPEGWP